MKTIYIILLFVSIGYSGRAQNLQNISEENNNAVSFSIGYDYGMIYEIDYHRKLNVDFTSWINFEYSSPFGNKPFDDFKTKFGIDIEALKLENFHVYMSLKTGFRRYNSEMVRYNAIGSKVGITAGFYKSNWYLAGEFAYNNSATIHIKHTDAYKEIYPDVNDGYYFLTGSHLNYGINTGVLLKESCELNLRAGLTNDLVKVVDATLPYYFQLGIIKSF